LKKKEVEALPPKGGSMIYVGVDLHHPISSTKEGQLNSYTLLLQVEIVVLKDFIRNNPDVIQGYNIFILLQYE